ncbi:MAG: nitrilase-related carbon-nitrogen hydrolase [Gammaproteobacteria bacterium]
MKTLRISAIQMNSGEEVAANLTRARRALRRAATDGAQLAVLPENFARMGKRESDRLALVEEDGAGPLQDFMAAEAARAGMWIVGGTIPLKSDEARRPFASTLVYDGNGQRVARYDKIHLFDARVPDSEEAYRESRGTTPGSTPVVIETPWGQLGVAVCYDLRFPELFRRMSSQGMDVTWRCLPTRTLPTRRHSHFRSKRATRAINLTHLTRHWRRSGTHRSGQTWGHSMLKFQFCKLPSPKLGAPGCYRYDGRCRLRRC